MAAINAPCSKEFKAAHQSGRRGKQQVHWIVLHDTEGGTARSVAEYFTNPDSGGSTHLVVDENDCYKCLEQYLIPWGAASAEQISANTHGFHIEQCGYAKWSSALWWSHVKTLRRAAYKTAVWAQYYNIPLVWVDADALLHGHRGITTHAQVSKASRVLDPANAGRYSHSDPGLLWPRRFFMRYVRQYAAQLGYPPKA